MRSVLLIIIMLLFFNNLFSQRLLSGKVLLDENHPYYGIYVCDYSNLSSYVMVSSNGKFSIMLSDTSKFIVTSSMPPISLYFDNLDYLYKRFDVSGKDSLVLLFRTDKNTFDSIPHSYKVKRKIISGQKYFLKYNCYDSLKSIVNKTNQSKYKMEFKYNNCNVQISNYIYDIKTKDYFFLSNITYIFDNRGAIRQKNVSVEYGMHSSWEQSNYFYFNNEIYKVEVYSNENIGKTIHTTYMRNEITDPLIKFVQNEILRKRLYLSCRETFFEFDSSLNEFEK